MAGVGPVLENIVNLRLPRCHDGAILEPVDTLFLLFRNKGFNATGLNACFVGKRFEVPLLRNLLPDPTAYFTPDDFIDCLTCLFITSVLVTLGMVLVKKVWCYLDSDFRAITPSHKQWYVVANLSKSFFLGCMALSSRYWIGVYQGYILDKLPALALNYKRCGMLYIATDLVALYMVPKLPRSTLLHHITTTLLIVMVTAVNLTLPGYGGLLGVCKMAILYGIFSTIAYLVNAYLALRVVYSKTWWLPILVRLSLWPYVLCCICNWSVHLFWLVSLIVNMELSIINVVYLVAISMMVNDDVILIKWLMKRSSPILENTTDKEK